MRNRFRQINLVLAFAGVVVTSALLSAGCAAYRLGPSNGMAAGDKSIRVLPFANVTMQPRLTDEVTEQIREQIQRDGTFRLSSRGDADITVTGTIISYDRFEMSFVPDDILTVRDFRVRLTARVIARDRLSGDVLLDKNVTGTTLVRVGFDLTSAERQALPLLAADLARNTTTLLADGIW